ENEIQQPVAPVEDANKAGDSEFSAAPSTTGVGPGMGQSFGFGGRPPGGGFPGGRGFARGPEGGPGMYGPGMMPGGRGPMGPGGPEGGPGGYRGGGGPGQAATQHNSLPKGVDYYLLRFLDFSVEPGKKYKYRVKLVLQDPNYGLPQGVLSPAV